VVPYPSTDTAFGIWSLNEIRDARRGDNWATPPPIAPTIVTANDDSTVSFSGQTVYGESPIYTVTSDPDNITATGLSSPISVSGLTIGTEYTFTVTVEDIAGSSTSDLSNAVTVTSFGSGTNGSDYVQNYLLSTGGSLNTVNTSDDLRQIIDNASDGDAILISPGTYQIGPKDADYPAERSIFGDSDVLICGDTDDAADVVIDFNHDEYTSVRDHPVFIGSTPSTNTQLAFLTYFRNPDATISTNYNTAMALLSNTDCFGIAVNVYFDLDNDNVSWHYDNSNSSGNDVRFIRCTFANYSDWLSSYSGRDDQIDVGNCLFNGSIETGEFIDLGGNVTNASINETSRTYSTSTYSSAGHLYVPNTDAIF